MSASRNLARIARRGVITVDTAQDLRALVIFGGDYPTAVETLGALAAGDGGGGIWEHDSASTATDDLGTVLTAQGGGRWLRQHIVAVNPKWFGAAGDDTNDDTAPLQAALEYTMANAGTLVLPQGTYKITAPLVVIEQRGWTLAGLSRFLTTIKQYTDNASIIEFRGRFVHSWTIRDVRFLHANKQPFANSSGNGIHFVGDPASPDYSSAYEFSVRDVNFENQCHCIKTSTANQYAVWGASFERIWSRGHSGSFFNVRSAQNIGQPDIWFNNVYIRGDDCVGDAVVFDAPAARIIMGTVEINTIHNGCTAFKGGGNANLIAQQFKVEGFTYDVNKGTTQTIAANGLLNFDATSADIRRLGIDTGDNGGVDGYVTTTSGDIRLINAYAGQVTIGIFEVSLRLIGAATVVSAFYTNAGGRIHMDNMEDITNRAHDAGSIFRGYKTASDITSELYTFLAYANGNMSTFNASKTLAFGESTTQVIVSTPANDVVVTMPSGTDEPWHPAGLTYTFLKNVAAKILTINNPSGNPIASLADGEKGIIEVTYQRNTANPFLRLKVIA